MSPKLRPALPGLRTGTVTENVTRRTTKGLSPSLGQRLSRTLANSPSTDDDHWDHEEDVVDPDPWDELPEELEPSDLDEPADGFDIDSRAGRRRLMPSITFASFTGWADRPDPLAAYHVGRASSRSPSVPGVTFRIAGVPSGGPDYDELAVAEVEANLAAIAAALTARQFAAVTAGTSSQAFDALVPMTQRMLAEAAGLNEPAVSRRRLSIIECPWGQAQLQFFCWKRKSDMGLHPSEARRLVEILIAQPRLAAAAAGRLVAEEFLADESVIAKRADALRKQVPVVRSVLLEQLGRFNTMAAALPLVDLEELTQQMDKELRSHDDLELRRRGMGLVRLALAGAFAGLETE